MVTGVLTTYMVVKPAENPKAQYLASTYAADWSDASTKEVTYFGILAEYVWYTMAAVDLAVQVGAINETTAQQARATVLAIGATTLQAGFDSDYGGLIHAAVMEPQQAPERPQQASERPQQAPAKPQQAPAKPQQAPAKPQQAPANATQTEKYWWVQLEGALAMMSMFRATGNQAYLQMLDRTLAFILKYLWDDQYGELYMVADRTGKLWGEVACGAAGNVNPSRIKACGNKSSWHTGRALVQLYKWLLDEGVQGMTHCNS